MTQLEISPLATWEAAGGSLLGNAGFANRESGPVFGRFGRSYVPEAMPDAVDRSFLVFRDKEPVLVVDCRKEGDGFVWSGEPVRFWLSTDMTEGETANILACGIRELARMAVEAAASKVRIAEPLAGDRLSHLGKLALNIGARPTVRHIAIADLVRPDAEIRAALRKSFRSLVNWGKRNLRLDYINRGQQDPEKFMLFQQFHKKVAGRETRSARSWALQYDAVVAGQGEAVLGYSVADDALVSAALVLDGARDAVYFSGVYDRDRFDKPLGHWPLQDAIFRSKARGLKRFVLGELPLAGSVSEKENNIAYFKRGFATDILQELVWEWQP